MASVHEVIEAFRQAPRNAERGTKFEQLMVRYFELDPMLGASSTTRCGAGSTGRSARARPDTGIDLVARERDTGELTAIQCKFYEPTHTLAKARHRLLLHRLGQERRSPNRIIISTTDKWGKNAEDALEDQPIPVAADRPGRHRRVADRLGHRLARRRPARSTLEPARRKRACGRTRQTAIDEVLAGFADGHDRGKLIMACGTGKTFTALKIAERTPSSARRRRVLFLVPSISLLSQTLREWTAQTRACRLRPFAVCSDAKVGRRDATRTSPSTTSPLPATTDPAKLLDADARSVDARRRADGGVLHLPVASTSSPRPRQLGLADFDLIICDEAHRTTGVTLAGEDESAFVRVHDNDYLRAAKRLYMTATPRIYDDDVKAKAERARRGPRLDGRRDRSSGRSSTGSGSARPSSAACSPTTRCWSWPSTRSPSPDRSSSSSPTSNDELQPRRRRQDRRLLERPGQTRRQRPDGTGFDAGRRPMRRAVAFAGDIKASKQLADAVPRRSSTPTQRRRPEDDDEPPLTCEVRARRRHLQRPASATRSSTGSRRRSADGELPDPDQRPLPVRGRRRAGLDAVMFLHPRKSVVDVVQSVGRVMRQRRGQGVRLHHPARSASPPGMTPEEALADNKRYKVVWQVLQALRAHDERFNAMVNQIELNKATRRPAQVNDQLSAATSARPRRRRPTARRPADRRSPAHSWRCSTSTSGATRSTPGSSRRSATARYWEDWAKDVADIADRPASPASSALLDDADPTSRDAVRRSSSTACAATSTTRITEDDAIEMLAQHLITRPVFDALFEGYALRRAQPGLPGHAAHARRPRRARPRDREPRRSRASTTRCGCAPRASTTPRASSRSSPSSTTPSSPPPSRRPSTTLGIVYTPVEIVDFILRSADDVLRQPSSARASPTRASTSSTPSPAPAPSSSGCSSPA